MPLPCFWGGRLTQASRLGNASKIGPFFLKYAVPISQKTCRATLSLVACGSKNDDTKDPAADGEKQTVDFPTRDITMIVPFGAGGATDLICRTLAAEMEKDLGVSIAVTNMPGSASAVGTEYVYEADHDGYTILGYPTDITSIKVMGQSDLTYEDWNALVIGCAVPTSIVVKPDSPYQTLEELVAAMKAEQLTIATSDSGCAFTRGLGLILQQEPDCIQPELIPSGGGANAALSAVKGDVDAAACGLPECIEYVRSGDLKVLTYMGSSAITIEGANGSIDIPWVCDVYPQLEDNMPFGGWVGMAVAADTDPEIYEILRQAAVKAYESDAFQTFVEQKTFVPMGISGQEANDWAKSTSYINSWMLYDMGFTTTSPETFGWPHP